MKEGSAEVVASSTDDSSAVSSMGVAALVVVKGIRGRLRTDPPTMSPPTMSSWLEQGIALKTEMVSYKPLVL